MKLATFSCDGAIGVGVVDDARQTIQRVHGAASMLELAQLPVSEILERLEEPRRRLDEVRLLAPFLQPRRNIFCIGWNYLAHFEEGKDTRPPVELPERPSIFTKATTTVCGPYDDVPLHAGTTERLDWEAELAVVIGRGGADIAEQDALEHVFAYAVANDISARDVQRAHGGQWFKGKSLDGTCPLGPWLTTSDEVDPAALNVTCRLNGQTMQHAHTRQMIFPVARIVAELSRGMTLLSGDVILTGTPEGIGGSRVPPVFLQAGDVLETEVSGLGKLRNRIVP
ncbi:fumarylacetoacetate hydrolase family protein [Paraburkholderia oxyphila]|uniref:fumarylacetoacetate hydrolase family protein n=1 Tax=Paraburkholderia oxyphila TaxID=614212 RepID=UPI0004851537|nr:fumarylacetoacetate hydrolase family protein [Paraburkholderia oxyphila]